MTSAVYPPTRLSEPKELNRNMLTKRMPRLAILLAAAVLSLLAALIVSSPAAVSAQDKQPACAPATVIQQANDLKSSGNQKADLDTLSKLSASIDSMKNICNPSGLSQTISARGVKVVGPINLPRGVFRATLTTGNTFIAVLRVVSGACDTGAQNDYNLFNLLPGDASSGAEGLIVSEKCTLFIVPVRTVGNWTINIDPITVDGF